MNHLYKILLLLILTVFVLFDANAQCSGVSILPVKASYCAGEPITVSVISPTLGITYRIVINGDVYPDTVAVVGLPGAATTRDYYIDVQFINPLGQWSSCQPIPPLRPKVTIAPSPDPTLIDISPNKSGEFKQCSSVSPYQFVVQNGSSTASAYTQTYLIDWGDGTNTGVMNVFSSSLTHNYPAPGYYDVKFTVTSAQLSPPCNTVTQTYKVYFGVLPNIGGIGRLDPTIKCVPAIEQFLIDTTLTNRNSPGTEYSVKVDGVAVANFSQPIPRSFNYTFTKTSCGKSCGAGLENFEVIVTAKNLCGVSQSTVCVGENEKPKPQLQVRDTVCLNTPTNHTNATVQKELQGTGKCNPLPTTWHISPHTWTLNSGDTLSSSTIVVSYNQTGTYTVNMTVESVCGDSSISKQVVVVEKVKALAKFVSPPCIPASGFVDVPISNFSTRPPSARGYTWTITPNTGVSFVSGNDHSDSVTVRFTISGSYNVHLAVNGACNNAVWDSTLVIKGKPVIDTSRIPEACFFPATLNPNNYFTFNNGGDPNATFAWTFTGGNPASASTANPGTINYASSGTFPILLHITNICGDSSLTNSFTVNNYPKPFAGNDTGICIGTPSFQLHGTPAGGIWSGGHIDSTGVFDPAGLGRGNYPVIYTTNQTSSCPTRDTLLVKISKLDSIALAPQTVCKSTRAVILAGSAVYPNGNWSGPGVVNSTTGLFDPVGLLPGFHDVYYTYQDSSGACTKTAIKRVNVLDSVWIGTPPVLCVNQSFDFGTISGNIQTATWKFGDGTPNAIIPNPSHIYASAGNFNVTLYAETADHCKDTILIPVKVIKNPPLSFLTSNYDSCTGNAVTFSFPPTHDTATHYAWSFGVSSLEENLPNTHIINFPPPRSGDSTYIITLRADYYCGPVYFSDTIKVKSKPKADFQVQPIGCSPFKPTVLNQSYGSPTSYIWDFGNGITSTLQNPVVPTYINNTPRDTTYTIKLKVSNTCGTDSTSETFVLKGNNVNADFFTNITQGCRPLNVNFYSISTPGVQLIWDFGDGQQGFAEELIHTYDTSGVFRVKLLAVGSCGRDSAFTNINVFPKPKANFTVKNPCVGKTTQFINASTNGNSFIWDFGDGSAHSSLQNPTHVYTVVGPYVVKLIVSNANGCVDSIETTIGVTTQPTAGFAVEDLDLCQNEPVILRNTAQNGNNFIWYFGNGETSTDVVPNYTYPNPGTYTITQVAINGACRDSLVRPAAIQIHPTPLAEFIAELTANKFNDPVVFNNQSSNANSYIWLFGDGDSSVVADPTHLYTGDGPYRVTLYAVSSFGCKDTVSHDIGVDSSGVMYIPNVFAPEIGSGEGAVFLPKTKNLVEYRLQIFSTYGQLLWESTALKEYGMPAEGWDGRFKGTLMPQDVYVWKIFGIFENGKVWDGMVDPKTGKKSVMGAVLLLR